MKNKVQDLESINKKMELSYKNKKLTEFPSEIFEYEGLVKLDLSNNLIKKIPPEIKNLSKLEDLIISENSLFTIPEEIGNLPNLQSLDLSNNRIENVPESLCKLENLNFLYLSGNLLKELPENIESLSNLEYLYITNNKICRIPDSFCNLAKLLLLDLSYNNLSELNAPLECPSSLIALFLDGNGIWDFNKIIKINENLTLLSINSNKLNSIPINICDLEKLKVLCLSNNELSYLPEEIRKLENLKNLELRSNYLEFLPDVFESFDRLISFDASNNRLIDLPTSLIEKIGSVSIRLDDNRFNPELKTAIDLGSKASRIYLESRLDKQVTIHEAKLILVGEGNVGKSCLLSALCDEEFEEGRPTTHGIEIKPLILCDKKTNIEIKLNGWDFGGQPVYKPTHQLFFTSPAIYLVVWKPREGIDQNFVLEWTKLIKYREPEARIIICATHGGPHERQPDIDRQEFLDIFGEETIRGFIQIDSKPDSNTGKRKNIEKLKDLIISEALKLPNLKRSIPNRFLDLKEELERWEKPFISVSDLHAICKTKNINENEEKNFIRIFHELGYFINYEYDQILRDIVITKPNWLATAISFVLEDTSIRENQGIVTFSHLQQIWSDPSRKEEFRYPTEFHELFLRLMERFDLSYQIEYQTKDDKEKISLIAQHVQDLKPNISHHWEEYRKEGDEEKVQICKIIEKETGNSAQANGLFYQLIVRFNHYSLGKNDYKESIHWKRGLIIDDGYNGRALLEQKGNDIKVSVRAAYPEYLISMIVNEISTLVGIFWPALKCIVMVPCIEPCGYKKPGNGLYEVARLIESKHNGITNYPCPTCGNRQNINALLRNSIQVSNNFENKLWTRYDEINKNIQRVITLINNHDKDTKKQLSIINHTQKKVISQIDFMYQNIIKSLNDEAREGPRLFSLHPMEPNFLDKPEWMAEHFRLILWCEHSRLPLPLIYKNEDKSLKNIDDSPGVYHIELLKEWLIDALPYFKNLAGVLNLILPISISLFRLKIDERFYKLIEDELNIGKEFLDEFSKFNKETKGFMEDFDSLILDTMPSKGAILRTLHAFLHETDPSFGGLERVINKRNEFLWVHKKYLENY